MGLGWSKAIPTSIIAKQLAALGELNEHCTDVAVSQVSCAIATVACMRWTHLVKYSRTPHFSFALALSMLELKIAPEHASGGCAFQYHSHLHDVRI